MLEHDAHHFGDGITRRSPKRSQGEALLSAAGVWGPRRKYFRWGKDLRPRKLDETLSRHGRRARRVAFLSPSGSPPKVFSVGQSSDVRSVLFAARLSLCEIQTLSKWTKSISRILGGLNSPRGPRRMYIRKGKRSSRAIDERRSLRRREGEARREGGGTILPCQGREFYFTFEYDETRRKGEQYSHVRGLHPF